MSILNYEEYVNSMLNPKQRLQDVKASLTCVAGRQSSLWRVLPDAGATPTTAVACTRDTLGAIFLRNSTSIQRITQIVCSLQQSGFIVISDRLVQSGGLSAIVTTEQTTNLPTPDLPRYTDGVGVMGALEIYTALGATLATATVSYIDDRDMTLTSPEFQIGATGFIESGRMLEIPLASGSRGIKKVLSVKLSNSTVTAGNFGVTLYKPLFPLSMPNLGSQQFIFEPIIGGCGNFPEIDNGACLFYIVRPFTTSTGIWLSAIRIMEE